MRDTPLVDERFLLLETLGRGGMATVYRAFDRLDERVVALKVQRRAAPSGPSHPLAAEYDALTRLHHANVVAALELGVTRTGPFVAGTPYLVLENVSGGPLDRALAHGIPDRSTLEALAVDLLGALDHVHTAGLVHRDLKPSNVLLDTSAPGRTRFQLTDFGLAAMLGTAREPGVVSGSLPYLAPETILGLPLDGRADLYGLGILLFRVATGDLPFPRTSAEEVVRWHLTGPSLDCARLSGSAPLDRLVRGLTERDRARRPVSARAALDTLEPAGAASSASVRPVDRGERARLRLALDAARLGARRVASLPAAHDRGEALVRQVRYWSHVHGLDYHDLGRGVAGLVMRLLIDPRLDGRAIARRHGLERWLAIADVGGIPVFDRSRLRHAASPRAVRAVASFLLECADARGLVLLAPSAASDDRLATAVARELVRESGRIDRPRPGGRGLMMLVRREPRTAPRPASCRPASVGLPLRPIA